METFDYIVVGGGSAGCTITSRLINAGKSVLLLEAGPRDNTKFVEMPATFVRVIGTHRTWIYESEPQTAAGGRRIYVPQGRTLGGGSSVNAMVYIRGMASDYDGWRDAGCTGWSWEDVLPAFKRAESNQRFSEPFHGTNGPLKVSDQRYRHVLSYAFARAVQEAGFPYCDDFNTGHPIGVGFYQTTTYEGRRGSTSATYLRAVLNNPKLKVMTDAHVMRIDLENGVPTGVALRRADGSLMQAAMRDELILAAGALSTPKILMLSGIGPAAELARVGIPVIRDMPAVGTNFQDHLEVAVYAQTRDPISMVGNDKGLKAAKHGLQWTLFKTGLLTSNVVECGGFFDTRGDGKADIQTHFLPALVGDVGREPLAGHGFTINPSLLRPKSRGTVRLRSADPLDPILFDPQTLSQQEDVDTLVRGVKLARKILRQPSFAPLVERELLPGADPNPLDAALEEHVRRYAKTVYHPSGTCRMGGDTDSVVDPTLRVRGVNRLRICDCSVMPTLVSGNTNAPTIMIAERCADFILGSTGRSGMAAFHDGSSQLRESGTARVDPLVLRDSPDRRSRLGAP